MRLFNADGGLNIQRRKPREDVARDANLRMRIIIACAFVSVFEHRAPWLLDCIHANPGACDGYQRSV